jgi:uncharacterized protein with HEPN domain
MQRRADVYIELALLALRKVPLYLEDRDLAAYLKDDRCQAAIERQLEIAGDALGQLRKFSPELFERIPDGNLVMTALEVLLTEFPDIK